MATYQMIKIPGGSLRPISQDDADKLNKIANGSMVEVVTKVPRNPLFHAKYFALLGFAFEYWNPPEVMYKGVKSEKSMTRFRNELAIQSGHYTVVVSLKGEVKLEPKSISFAEMAEEEFHDLYKNTFNILWDVVLSKVKGMTQDKAEQVMLELLRLE